MIETVINVVETDLRLLTAEAKKADGPMQSVIGFLHHSEVPQIKDGAEKALLKLKLISQTHGGLVAVQDSLVRAPRRREGERLRAFACPICATRSSLDGHCHARANPVLLAAA